MHAAGSELTKALSWWLPWLLAGLLGVFLPGCAAPAAPCAQGRHHAHAALPLPGAKKVTNKATLWYVPLALKNVNKVVEVPPIQVGLGTSTGVPGVSRAGGRPGLLTGTRLLPMARGCSERAFLSSMRGRSRRTRGGSAMKNRSWIGWKPSKGTAT